MNYYSNLWTDSSTEPFFNILSALPDDLPQLSASDYEMLIGEVTKEEIYRIAMDLPTGKSIGLDGFNAEFYQFFWPDLGDHLFATI